MTQKIVRIVFFYCRRCNKWKMPRHCYFYKLARKGSTCGVIGLGDRAERASNFFVASRSKSDKICARIPGIYLACVVVVLLLLFFFFFCLGVGGIDDWLQKLEMYRRFWAFFKSVLEIPENSRWSRFDFEETGSLDGFFVKRKIRFLVISSLFGSFWSSWKVF